MLFAAAVFRWGGGKRDVWRSLSASCSNAVFQVVSLGKRILISLFFFFDHLSLEDFERGQRVLWNWLSEICQVAHSRLSNLRNMHKAIFRRTSEPLRFQFRWRKDYSLLAFSQGLGQTSFYLLTPLLRSKVPFQAFTSTKRDMWVRTKHQKYCFKINKVVMFLTH